MFGNTESPALSKTGLLGLLLGAASTVAGYQLPLVALQWVGFGVIAVGAGLMIRPAVQAVRA